MARELPACPSHGALCLHARAAVGRSITEKTSAPNQGVEMPWQPAGSGVADAPRASGASGAACLVSSGLVMPLCLLKHCGGCEQWQSIDLEVKHRVKSQQRDRAQQAAQGVPSNAHTPPASPLGLSHARQEGFGEPNLFHLPSPSHPLPPMQAQVGGSGNSPAKPPLPGAARHYCPLPLSLLSFCTDWCQKGKANYFGPPAHW